MAVSKMKGKTKAKGGYRPSAASMLPDEMQEGGGGLDTNFTATVEEARIVPYNYGRDGNDGKPALEHKPFVRLKLRPDEEQDEDAVIRAKGLEENDGLIIYYASLGAKLEHWVPSVDGENPVDLDSEDETDWEGVYAIPTEALIELLEKKGIDLSENPPQLNKGSNWAFFMTNLLDAKFPRKSVSADITFLEGQRFKFTRVPQPKRAGMQSADGEGQQNQSKDILVVSEVLEAATKKGPGKAGTKASAKASNKPAAKTTSKAAPPAKGPAASTKTTKKKVVEEEEEEAEDEEGGEGDGDVPPLHQKVIDAIVAELQAKGEAEDEDGNTVYQLSREDLHRPVAKSLTPKEKREGLELLDSEEFFETYAEKFILDEDDNVTLVVEE